MAIFNFRIHTHSERFLVQIRDGFFLHSFAPEEKSLPKHVIFLLDVSGAMSVGKQLRLKHAAVTILNSLTREDYFNIIFFKSNDEVSALL